MRRVHAVAARNLSAVAGLDDVYVGGGRKEAAAGCVAKRQQRYFVSFAGSIVSSDSAIRTAKQSIRLSV